MPFYNISLSLIDNLDCFSQNEKRILFDKETYITCYLEARSKNSVRKRMRRVTSHGRKKGEIFFERIALPLASRFYSRLVGAGTSGES